MTARSEGCRSARLRRILFWRLTVIRSRIGHHVGSHIRETTLRSLLLHRRCSSRMVTYEDSYNAKLPFHYWWYAISIPHTRHHGPDRTQVNVLQSHLGRFLSWSRLVKCPRLCIAIYRVRPLQRRRCRGRGRRRATMRYRDSRPRQCCPVSATPANKHVLVNRRATIISPRVLFTSFLCSFHVIAVSLPNASSDGLILRIPTG